MQNQTLKAFYYGNLFPAEKRMVRGSEAARVMKELSDAEAQLSRSVPSELQSALERLTKAQGDIDGIIAEASYIDGFIAEASYIDGFKTGARFMMEILDDVRENLKPVTE